MKASVCPILAMVIMFLTAGFSGAMAQEAGYQVRKVIIDPGHGGKDPGALGKKSKEKALTLAISKKLGGYISQNVPGVEVAYTRSADEYIDLKGRAAIINESGADVLISIHINANKNPKVYGTCTYVSGTARDDENLAIQRQENGGDDLSGEDFICLANIQKQNHANSALLAGKIQDQFRTRAGRRDRGVEQANFAVLWRANMTAVLIECGFISNPAEERFMTSDDGQAYIASAIYRAFKEYKAAVEGTAPAAAPRQEAKPAQDAAAGSKIYFRVQVKSSPERIPLASSEFKGLNGVEELLIDGVYKYTVGKTQNYSEILKIQGMARQKIKDSFVIATKGSKRIDLKEARKELESGK